MKKDLIIVSEYCQKSDIDPTFMALLEESELIEITTIEDEKYIDTSKLGELEIFTRMYYDLSINVEGIDAIHHLLNRVINLRNEIKELRSRLNLYESDSEITEII